MTIHPYNTPGRTWRIATITFTAPPGLPGLRQSTINTIRTSDTTGPWVGWEFEVDGASLLMISPPGWQAGKAERIGDKVTVYEVSKALAAIAWEYEQPATWVIIETSAPGYNGVVSIPPEDRDGLGQPLRWRDSSSEGAARMTGIAEYIPADVAANEATIAAAVAAYASPLPAEAPVERDEPPDEPVVDAKPQKRGPGRPRKAP